MTLGHIPNVLYEGENNMKLIHICDTHFDKRDLTLWNDMMESLFNTIADNCKDELFDMVLFSGDLIKKGKGGCKTIDEGFESFEKHVVEPFRTRFRIGNEKIILTPGNHDIDRQADPQYTEDGLKKHLSSRENVKEFIEGLKEGQYDGIRRIFPYKKFIDNFYKDNQVTLKKSTLFYDVHEFELNGVKVGVASINTAWRCYNSAEDVSNIIVGLEQYVELAKYIDDCDIKIALMHHPLSNLADFNKKVIETRVIKDFDILLFGHQHESEVTKIERSGSYEIVTSGGTQLSTGNIDSESYRYYNGFSIINLNTSNNKLQIEIIHYIYKLNENRFIVNTFMMQEGVSVFSLNKNMEMHPKKSLAKELVNGEIISLNEKSSVGHGNRTSLSDALEIDKVAIEFEYQDCAFYNYKDEIIRNIGLIDKKKLTHNIISNIDFLLLYLDKSINDEEIGGEIKEIIGDILKENDKLISIQQLNRAFYCLDAYLNLELFKDVFPDRQDIYSKFDLLINKENNEIQELIKDIGDVLIDLKEYRYDEISTISEAHKKVYCTFMFIYCTNLICNNNLKHKINKIILKESINNILLEDNKKDIFAHINNKYILIVGNAGVGKTTLVTQIYNEIVEKKELSKVLFINCSSYQGIIDILEELVNVSNTSLAKKIKIDFSQFDKQINIDSVYTKIITVIIRSLKLEFKNVFIIFDDIDLGSKRLLDVLINNNLDANFIFTSKEQLDIEMPIFIYSLNNIKKDNLKELTGISDKDINDQIFDTFDGNITDILNFTSPIKEQEKNKEYILALIDKVKSEKNEYLINYADAWFDKESVFMEETLFLLSIFSIINVISYEQLQRYLCYVKLYIKKPRIRFELMALKEQIIFVDSNKFKLHDNEYSRFIYDEYFSELDFEKGIKWVFDWIYNEAEEGYFKIVVEFLGKIKNINSKRVHYVNDLYQLLLSKIENLDNGKNIFEIGYLLYIEYKELEEIAIKLMNVAGNKGCLEAKEFLGYYYINSGKCVKVEAAKENLLDAIRLGSNKAKFLYAIFILFHYFHEVDDTIEKAMEMLWDLVEKCEIKSLYERALLIYIQSTFDGIKSLLTIDEAVNRLKDLSEKNDSAKVELANIYIKGCYVKRDVAKGIELLEEAKENNDLHGAVKLSRGYIYGINMPQNITKGVEILNTLDKEGCDPARLELIQAHIHGFVDMINSEKAIEMLEGFNKNRNPEAILLYSNYLINENIDKDKGLSLLHELKENGNRDAAYELGCYYLENKKVLQNAIEYFKEAMEKGHIEAQTKLAQIYLDQETPFFAPEYGEQLLREASKLNNSKAQIKLAQYLLRNTKSLRAKEEAIDILENHIKKGNANAERLMGSLLLNSKYGIIDCKRAEKLLESAVSKGNLTAVWELGQRYMQGISLNRDLKKAENILRLGISRNDDFSRAYLGKHILSGDYPYLEKAEGIQLLTDAVLNKDPYAKLFLGNYYIRGIAVEQDKEYGEQLLRAAGEEISEALLELAIYKLDGRFLERNVKKGKELLEQAAKSDNSAKLMLAKRLLDGEGIEQDHKRGLSLITVLVNEEEKEAKIEYAKRLIVGNGVPINKEKGMKLLEELMELNDRNAKKTYAHYLMTRRISISSKLESSKERAIELLEENILEQDAGSMFQLGDNLIKGIYLDRDVEKGVKLFQQAIELGDTQSMTYYGKLLIYGDILSRNKKKGEELLEKAIYLGNQEAKFTYSKFCIEKYVLDDYELGFQYIQELISDGYTDAIAYWASALLTGSYTDRNIEEGKRLYENMIKLKNNFAIVQYSEYLINNQYLEKNIVESERILQIGIKNNYDNANYIKAQRMLNGLSIKTRGKKKATNLFERLYEKGIGDASFEYGIRLMKGNLVKKNEVKGKKIIEKLINDADLYDIQQYANIAYQLKDYKLASELFERCYALNTKSAINSIAYMVRRDEFVGDINKFPEVDQLLKPEIEGNSYIAKINYVLFLVQNTTDNEKWKKGDKIIKELGCYSDDIDWWYRLMVEGDDEGKLVIAWLLRYDYLWDNNRYNFEELLNEITEPRWIIPSWMFNKPNRVALTG